MQQKSAASSSLGASPRAAYEGAGSEPVRFSCAQAVDRHGRSVAWTDLAAFRSGIGPVGEGDSVGP